VALFLLEEGLDDMVKDVAGKTCLDVAGGSETATLISGASQTVIFGLSSYFWPMITELFPVSRSHYNESYLTLLAAYIASPSADATTSRHYHHASVPSLSATTSSKLPQPPLSPISGSPSSPSTSHVSAASGHVSNAAAEKLYHFIARPRSRCIEFGARDNATGTTVLHEAAKRKDLGIIKLTISKGGDVLARDRKGKIPIDLAKDERIKTVLRQGECTRGNMSKLNREAKLTQCSMSKQLRQARAGRFEPPPIRLQTRLRYLDNHRQCEAI
jgi:hypothetical protein